MKILVVDDSATIRDRLVEILSTLQGVEHVDTAARASEVRHAIESERPDVMVLDIHMPGGSGIEVLEALRTDQRRIMTIVLTNDPAPHWRAASLRAGADFFFDKSAEFQQAVDVIARLALGRAAPDDSLPQSWACFERLPVPAWIVDVDTESFKAVNEAAVARYGYSREEFLAMTTVEIAQPEAAPALMEQIARRRAGDTIPRIGRRHHLAKDGTRIDVDLAAFRVDLAGRRLDLVLAHDVSEYIRAEDDRKAGERVHGRLVRLLDLIDDAFIEIDLKGTITSWSPGAERMSGYTAAEIIGQSTAILIPPELMHEQADLISRIRDGESVVRRTTTRLRKDGARVECSIVAVPIEDGSGTIVGASGVVRDLTEHAGTMRALLEREAQFRGVVDRGTAGVYILSNLGHVLYVNAGFARLCGYSPDEVIGRSFLDFVTEADRQSTFESFHATLTGTPSRIDAHITTRDGTVRNVLADATLVQYDNQPAIIGVLSDITDLKQMEFGLHRSNRLLRTISAASEALVRAQGEAELLQSMCDVIVTVGGYRIASIMLRGREDSAEVVAVAGAALSDICAFETAWDGEATSGGPASAIRRGQSQIHQGLSDEPLAAPRLAAEGQVRACVYIPLKNRGVAFGSLGVYTGESETFIGDDLVLLTDLADDLAFGLLALRNRANSERAADRLQQSMEETIGALAAIAEMRDPYTAGHQRHVAELAVAIARKMGLDESRVRGLHLASIVHDIGKVKIPTEMLTKPTGLTRVEEQLMQTHVEAGYDILKGIDFPWPVAEVVLEHHERLDGSGYPRGLKAEAIHLEAKILGVADVVDAMAADRPYRFGKGIDAALADITSARGVLYDGGVVDACLALFQAKEFAFS